MANTNEALVYAWDVQALGATAGQTGYAQPAVTPSVNTFSTSLQTGAGLPSPAGSENVQGEAAGSQTAQILTNPGYADGSTFLGSVGAPSVPATTVAVQSPYGLAAQVTVACAAGVSVSVISVAPIAGGAAGTYSITGITVAASGTGTVTVPAGGFIKMTYTGGTPTWTWVTTN